jgi:hypothetical protein
MSPPDPNSPAILLVGTADYTHCAGMMGEMIRRFHPDWPIFFCQVDGLADTSRAEPFHRLEAGWLLQKKGALARFQYTPIELCGMSRPRAMLSLLDKGYSRILYFDLDMSIHAPLTPFTEALEKSCIVLTPHLLAPSTQENAELEECKYRLSGLVNAGCMAVREHPQSRSFLEWWSARTERHGHLDIAQGFYNEQFWVEYALSFYEQAGLLRHPGVNVAWWNLSERPLARLADGSVTAGGYPLVCFHWSGYRTARPELLTTYRNNSVIAPDRVLAELSKAYHQSLVRHGEAGLRDGYRYPYGHLSDGTPILPVWREAVRQRHKDLDIPEDPFEATTGWLRQLRKIEKKGRLVRKDWMLREAKALRRNKLFRMLRAFHIV